MKSMFSDEPVVHIAVKEEGGSVTMWNGVKTGIKELSENWNRTKGSKVSLYTYTNCDEVELLLNGKSLGRKKNPTDACHRNQILWKDIPYEKGTLQAIGYSASQRQKVSPIAHHEISTTGNTYHLYKGTALVILRSALKPSTVTLRVSSPKFKTVTCKLISLHQLSIISAK